MNMGLFDFIFKPKNVELSREADSYFRTLTAYHPHFTSWDGKLYESELVRSAIDARARHISKLKVEIQGAAKPTLQTKLRLKPNNWQTWSQFLYRVSTILDMHNSCVIVPVYDELMNPVGYYPVLPKKCEIIQDNTGTPFLRYEFSDGQKAADYLEECAILTKFQYKSDFFGETNSALDPTMALVHMNDEGIKEAIKNNATYRFMARMTNFSNTEDLKRERKRFTEANLRSEDANQGLLLFPNTYADIKEISARPYTVPEAELREIRTSVYNYFAVNEDILQSKAYGDAWSAFYESVIEPFAIQFSETMTQALFSDRERAQGSLMMATSNRLQYMTTKEKLDVSSAMFDRGIWNRDDVRDVWNMSPLPDGQGQAYIIRGEYITISEDGSFTREGTDQTGGESNADQE